MTDSTIKYGDLTQKLIASAMKVHRKMKNGYMESVYQKYLAIEFDKAALSFKEDKDIPIFYDEKVVGRRRADFILENKVVIELKSVINLENEPIAQAVNYLEASGLEICLLNNLGSKNLQFKRLLNKKRNVSLHHLSNPQNP